jgi:hypothetical protein
MRQVVGDVSGTRRADAGTRWKWKRGWDTLEKVMAGSPEIANWELLGTLVEPETNVWVSSAARTSDYLQEGKKPTLVVKNSEVAR